MAIQNNTSPQVVNANPSMNAGFFTQQLIQQAGRPLPVLRQQVDPEAEQAIRNAVQRGNVADEVLRKHLETSGLISAEKQQGAAEQYVAEKAALDAKNRREDEIVSLNRAAVAATGSDFTDPSTLMAKTTNKIAEVYQQRLDIADRINENKAIAFTEQPLSWLAAQFENAGLISQHNTLAATENSLHGSAQALMQHARNIAEIKKSTMPATEAEERFAEAEKLRVAFQDKQLAESLRQSALSSDVASGTYNILQSNASMLFNLSKEEQQKERQAHEDIVRSIVHEDGKAHRIMEAMQLDNSMTASLHYRNLAIMLGHATADTDPIAAGQLGFKAVQAAASAEEKEALTRLAWAGRANSVDDARIAAKYTNFDNIAQMRESDKPKTAEMFEIMNRANQYIDNKIAAGETLGKGKNAIGADAYKGMTKQQQAEMKMKLLRERVADEVKVKVMSATPAAVINAKPEVLQQFPELLAYAQNPSIYSEDALLQALFETSGGNRELAAKRYADYNRIRMEAVLKNTKLDVAGIPPLKDLTTSATVSRAIRSPFVNPAVASNIEAAYRLPEAEIQVNMIDPASVERYMLLQGPKFSGVANK